MAWGLRLRVAGIDQPRKFARDTRSLTVADLSERAT
jgi:hypothetical protein